MSVGMPAAIWLNKFGVIIHDMLDEVPYQVGSSLFAEKNWRDVDVRVIMDDTKFNELFGNLQNYCNPKLAAYELALSALGQQMTGLPIDFQIQSQSYANMAYGGKPRGALLEVR